MSDDFTIALDRQPTLQTITWLLSLRKFGQLDLDPPYQRKSVWTRREKQRFLDTIFRNYPSPAIFLHKELDDDGEPTYHVVDGKQRLSTILAFADNRLRIATDFGDLRLDGQNWKGLAEYPSARKQFWSYQLTVEFLDDVNEPLVREVFSRLNQNARKLERQEIRHARFSGWLINFAEEQADTETWRDLKVSTASRSKRMTDAQILLECAQVLLEAGITGFDQDRLDELCADYDDPGEIDGFESDEFEISFGKVAESLMSLNRDGLVSQIASSRNNFYSLWSYLALQRPDVNELGLEERVATFFREVERIKQLDRSDPLRDRTAEDPHVAAFASNSVGAATEEPQRKARHIALISYMGADKNDDAGVLD